MSPFQLKLMYERLSFGYQLTPSEQRWLWNTVVDALDGNNDTCTRSIHKLGYLSDGITCPECDGSGTWGEDVDWGLMKPFKCLCCNGLGSKTIESGEYEHG